MLISLNFCTQYTCCCQQALKIVSLLDFATDQLPSNVDSDQYLTVYCMWGFVYVYVIVAHQGGSSYDCRPRLMGVHRKTQ